MPTKAELLLQEFQAQISTNTVTDLLAKRNDLLRATDRDALRPQKLLAIGGRVVELTSTLPVDGRAVVKKKYEDKLADVEVKRREVAVEISKMPDGVATAQQARQRALLDIDFQKAGRDLAAVAGDGASAKTLGDRIISAQVQRRAAERAKPAA